MIIFSSQVSLPEKKTAEAWGLFKGSLHTRYWAEWYLCWSFKERRRTPSIYPGIGEQVERSSPSKLSPSPIYIQVYNHGVSNPRGHAFWLNQLTASVWTRSKGILDTQHWPLWLLASIDIIRPKSTRHAGQVWVSQVLKWSSHGIQ